MASEIEQLARRGIKRTSFLSGLSESTECPILALQSLRAVDSSWRGEGWGARHGRGWGVGETGTAGRRTGQAVMNATATRGHMGSPVRDVGTG